MCGLKSVAAKAAMAATVPTPLPPSFHFLLLPFLSFHFLPLSASLFTQELEKARWFNERLGTGIAFFQALSNLAINGEEWEEGLLTKP